MFGRWWWWCRCTNILKCINKMIKMNTVISDNFWIFWIWYRCSYFHFVSSCIWLSSQVHERAAPADPPSDVTVNPAKTDSSLNIFELDDLDAGNKINQDDQDNTDNTAHNMLSHKLWGPSGIFGVWHSGASESEIFLQRVDLRILMQFRALLPNLQCLLRTGHHPI